MAQHVDILGDPDGPAVHFVVYTAGVPGGRKGATTLCGLPQDGLVRRAWFAVGDRRGGAYYERACEACSRGLAH